MNIEKLRDLIFDSRTLKLAIIINLLGTLFGFYYYIPQLSATNLSLWIFVPDSPIATLAAAAAFFLYLRNNRNSLVGFFAFFGNLKYGVWTVFVLLYMYQGFVQMHSLPLYIFLIVSHLLMAAQAFVILDFTDFKINSLTMVAGWFVLNDLIDYSSGAHSALPESAGIYSPVALTAVLLTLTSIMLVYFKKK